jgi:ATP-dependent Clp protease adaptor protein ClpS
MAVDGQPRTRTPSMDLKLILPDVVHRLKRAYWRGRTLAAGLWRTDAARMAERRRGPVRPGDGGSGTAVITQTRTRTKRPNMYRVLLLNDDYTPMEFVVHVLQRFFNKDADEATRIMLHVHQHGVGECGVFTYEIAETKVTLVMDFARKHQHPLQCVMEKK